MTKFRLNPLALIFSLLSPVAASAEEVIGHARPWQLGFQEASSPTMKDLVWLHDHFLMYIITAITIFVLLLMVYIALRFNRRANPVPSKTTHNVKLETIWTVIPVIILVAIAIPSVRIHHHMEETTEADMTLKITGYQWYWGYEYPDQGGIAFESRILEGKDLTADKLRLLSVDNPLVVPVDTKIRVQLTGADVIHSWAMPAMGVKRDAVPGRLNETWFTANKEGVYYGQCSELCGVKHGFMPIEMHVVSKDAFAAWVKDKQKQAGITPPAATQAASAKQP